MTKNAVFELCEQIAPDFKVDPYLALAVCERESSYRHDVARLEHGFYIRYTEPDRLATTTEVLMATSFGLMQCMGQILRERGFFTFYLRFHNDHHSWQYHDPLGEVPVVKAINALMVRPAWQVEYGCKHLRFKIDQAGDEKKGILNYNGGGNPLYYEQVMRIYEKVKRG